MEKPGLRAGEVHSVQKTLETAEGNRYNRRNIHRLWSLGPKIHSSYSIRSSSYNIRINLYNFEGETKEIKWTRENILITQ